VLQTLDELVLEGLAKDALSLFTSSRGVAALDDESYDEHAFTFDVAMEDGVIIIAARSKGKEVLAGLRAQFAVELDLDVAVCCLES
jgi:hypothetical protein